MTGESWLSLSVRARLADECAERWARISILSDSTRHLVDFGREQSSAMLLKLFLEQIGAQSEPTGRSLRLLARDGGGISRFRSDILDVGTSEDVEWIVWGLSFATFRFHLFPIGGARYATPFCVSPVLVLCVRRNIVESSDLTRAEFAADQFDHIDWSVVESRLICLETPLDLFAPCGDCQDAASHDRG